MPDPHRPALPHRAAPSLAAALLALLTPTLLTPAPAHAGPPRTFFGAGGVGLPELLHAQAGVWLTPRLDVELVAGNVVFNTLVGIGATGYLLGESTDAPPRHALLLHGSLRLNPTLEKLQLTGGGETIGAALNAAGGYGFLADGGFLLRALVDVILYEDNGLAAGPGVRISVGWAF